MSEANNIPPADRSGGPMPRPAGEGVPKVEGGLKTPGAEDAVDPAPADSDRGDDLPGMVGEG